MAQGQPALDADFNASLAANGIGHKDQRFRTPGLNSLSAKA
jgi:hypothetical protein